jgi:hypothetical protein
MLASVELKKRENRDDPDFLQMNGYVPCSIYIVSRENKITRNKQIFFTGQLSAFIIQLVTWQVLTRSERKNKTSCNKNAIKNTEMLENYIYCIPIKKN